MLVVVQIDVDQIKVFVIFNFRGSQLLNVFVKVLSCLPNFSHSSFK